MTATTNDSAPLSNDSLIARYRALDDAARRCGEATPDVCGCADCSAMRDELPRRGLWPVPKFSGRERVLGLIITELEKAYVKHGCEQWSRHEAYAIIKEELDESWDEIKGDGTPEALEHELAQTAAMCIRFLETGDRNNKQHTLGSGGG